MAKTKTLDQLIADIKTRLDSLEDLTAWLIKANVRFKKGQRVQFSAKADRNGVTRIRKGIRLRGRVIEASDSFTVKVLLDGYKQPHTFHHAFFDSIRKRA